MSDSAARQTRPLFSRLSEPPPSVLGPGLRTLVDGLDHPEGICWSPAEQIFYAGGEDGQLYRFGLQDGRVELAATVSGGSILGLAVDGSDAVYLCDVGNGCVQQVAGDGRIRCYGEAVAYPNCLVFDSLSRLWVSDSGGWGDAAGAIVRVDPDGVTERVTEGLHFPNGLAINGGWLYVAESTWPRIVRIPLAGGELEPVVEFDEAIPDGLAFDAAGGLWIGCWQPNRVYRLAPDGGLQIVVDDWSGVYAPTPTNIAFAGPELDILALASLSTQAVAAIDPGISGAPLQYPTALVT